MLFRSHRFRLTDEGQFEIRIKTFGSWNHDTGTMFTPSLRTVNYRYIAPGEFGPWQITEAELEDYFSRAVIPIIVDEDLFWSNEVSKDRLKRQLSSRD